MNAYLLTRPEHDDTTFYLSSWSEETTASASERGIKVLDLHRKRANRAEVESMVNSCCPDFIVFNGHGDDNTVTGHDNQPLIIAGQNEHLLKSRVVYAISCRSARNLGPKSIQAGAISYTGYDDDFIFAFEPGKISRPLQDETAKLFLEPSKVFITSIIKGNSIADSRKRSEKLLRENMLRLLEGSSPDINLVRFLWWDLRHFVSHGDTEASI